LKEDVSQRFTMKIVCTVLLLFSLYRIQAQLCTGSLGDPTVHITFGAGANPGPSLPPSVTNYSYLGKDCPDEGQYTLISNSFECFSQAWHVIPADHTPNEARGYFMLVNSASSPGDFYVNTLTGLCANTTYEFAVWVMNVLRPASCDGTGLDPNFTFKIETTTGIVLATYNTNDVARTQTPGWRQLGLFFTTPPGTTSVVCRLTNNTAGGCGNDFAIDDITLSPCGPKVLSKINTNNSDLVEACVDANTSFPLSSTISAGYQNPVVQWQKSDDNGTSWTDIPGATNANYTTPAATAPGSTKYRMIISEAVNSGSANCRVAANVITVNITALPFVQATNYVFGCFGSDVALFASGGSSFSWTGPNGFTSNKQHPVIPKVKYSDAGVYKVVVSTAGGCANSDSTHLDIYPAAHAGISNDVTICEGKSATLTALGGERYRWFPKDGLSNDTVANPVASPLDNTRYKVTVYSPYGCTDTASVMVKVLKKPVANAGADKKTRVGLPVQLNGSVKGVDVSFAWEPSGNMQFSQSLQPKVNPTTDTKYTLIATSNIGCGSSSDEVFVKVYDRVLIPNAFSPNGDGINDSWVIEPLDLFDESVTHVYNRYGQVVYKSSGYSKPWDGTQNGKALPTGNYYYTIDLRINHEPPLTGWVYIVR
jgi:gliding motility-associated-like protein